VLFISIGRQYMMDFLCQPFVVSKFGELNYFYRIEVDVIAVIKEEK